jgi:hypothetical protein
METNSSISVKPELRDLLLIGISFSGWDEATPMPRLFA